MDDAIQDMFSKKLAEVVSDASMPELRKNITLDLANSLPIERDTAWWGVRAWVISHDFDHIGFNLTMGERLAWRKN
jgi:hypothetical protein